MKVLKLFTFLLIATINLKAQSIFPGVEIKDPRVIEEAIKQATLSEFIFEGSVIEQEYYKNPYDKNLYTINTINIYKIFKGQDKLNCGTVSLITRGGIDPNDTEMIFRGLPSHSEYYRKGSVGTFFCIQNDELYKQVNPTLSSDNPMLLRSVFPKYGMSIQYSKEITDIYSVDDINGAASGLLGLKFKSLSDFYDYINLAYGINLSSISYCNNSSARIPLNTNGRVIKQVQQSKVLNTQYEPVKVISNFIVHEQYINSIKHKAKFSQNRSGGDLTFSFENEELTFDAFGSYLEFDVYFSANSSGSYLQNAPLHIQYSTSAFGDSIFGRGNITITSGNLLNTTSYHNPMSISRDWDNQTVAVGMGSDNFYSPLQREEVPNTPTKYVHVKMKIKNCEEFAQINFTNASTTQNVTFYTLNPTTDTAQIYFWNNVNYVGGINDKTCVPIIDNVTTTANAGIGDIITIDGKYFGKTKKSGEVWVKNANDGGFTYIKIQDSLDYISWNDKQIKLYCTSKNLASSSITDKVYMGSGPIYVENNLAESTLATTPAPLKVPFAITNGYRTTTKEKIISHITDRATASPSNLIFQCDTSISNYPIRKACVQKAIDIWNCRTGVNWSLGADVSLLIPDNQDGISCIYINDAMHGEPVASTLEKGLAICPASTDWTYDEVDMAFSIDFTNINSRLKWWYNTNNSARPDSTIDFLSVLIHELGHAHSIEHNNDPQDIMYYAVDDPYTSTPASQRHEDLNRWVTSIDAGNWIITKSQSVNWGACSITTMSRQFPANCGIFNGIEDVVVNQNDFLLYPNPSTNSSVNVKINTSTNTTATCLITDITGKELFTQADITLNYGNNLFAIDIANFSKGTYMVNIKSEKFSTIKRLVIQ